MLDCSDSSNSKTNEVKGKYDVSPVLLDFYETCLFLNIKKSMLRKLVFGRSIPFLKIGKNLRFDRSLVEGWLQKNTFYPDK